MKNEIKKSINNPVRNELVAGERKFVIYPNPVSPGDAINLSFSKLEEGYYNLQLLSQSGQSIYHQEIWIDAEARLLSIDVPEVAAGNYLVVMVNKKTGKKFTEKIIIE
jgi:hypothetical protein